MKVLYIGIYRDGTGWSNSAIDYILALDAAGVEVVCRPLKLNKRDAEVPKRIDELEHSFTTDATHVIQNVLPQWIRYHGDFEKSIALYFTETDHFRNTSWAQNLSLMDESWVSCNQMVEAAKNSYVSCPLAVVPVPCDTSKYQKDYDPIDLPGKEGLFNFYFIGEATKRKNLEALLKAFHLEFRPIDKVQLVIKAHIPTKTTQQSERIIRDTCSTVKNALKIYRNPDMYHEEVIITNRFTEEQMMRLHSTCDCFVMPSHGEAWCIPAFDAMAMGKTPICTNVGGPADFLYKKANFVPYTIPNNGYLEDVTKYKGEPDMKGGWLVDCQPSPCYEVRDTFEDLYVSNENWQEINIQALRDAMREAYENKAERENRAEYGQARAYDYTHMAVGTQMKELLDGTRKAVLHDWASQIREKHTV